MSDTRPKLRFSGFNDAWVQRNLGEWSDVRDGTHASPKYIEQGHPMVTSKNLTDSGLEMSDVSYLTDEDFNEINKRSKVDIGDILFGMIGTIGHPVIVDRDDFAIKNVALIKEKTSPEIINTWLIQYLKSPSFERFVQKENAGGTQKFIALGLIRDMKLMTPSVQEQARIGELLTHLDNLIAANQRKVDALKLQKNAYLERIFNQSLRFSGFTEPWVQRKLGEMFDYERPDKYIVDSDDYDVVGTPVLTANKSFILGYTHEDDFYDKGDSIIFDDFTLDNKYVDFPYKVKSSAIKILTPTEGANLRFAYELLNHTHIDQEGHARHYISIVQPKKVLVPEHGEQDKIATLFERMDNLIAANQRKIDLLNQQKTAYLQKMFI